MYGKLFASMYDGTLGMKGPWQALVTFQQMIILADKNGTIDMTPAALSRRTTIPLRIILVGIAALESPDSSSRTPDEDGRRIVRLSDARDWGWRITNYAKYRAIRTADERREYQRQYWHTRKLNNSTETQPAQPNQPIAVSSKQEAVSSSSSSPRETLLSAVANRPAWEAVLNGALQGLDGPMLSPEQLDRAVTDYVGNGEHAKPNLRHFRAYLRAAVRPVEQRRSAGGIGQRAFDTTMDAIKDMG